MPGYINLSIDHGPLLRELEAVGVQDVIDRVFGQSKYDYFEDGMDSRFTLILDAVYALKGTEALCAIDHRLLADTDSPDVLSEALRWLGRIGEDLPRAPFVDFLLRYGLTHRDLAIADAASCAISGLDDPAFIPDIQNALLVETNNWQREWLGRVLEQLKSTEQERKRGRD